MAVKERLYPTEQQLAGFIVHAGQARLVYNIALEQRSMWHPGRRTQVGFKSQSRELTALRSEVDWLRAGSTVVQQGALRDLDRAFTNFFEGRTKYPKRRKKSDKQSFVVRDIVVKRLTKRTAVMFVPKVGWVKFRLTRPWKTVKAATSARVTQDSARTWHVSFTTELAPFTRVTTNQTVGVDRGVTNTLALSNGVMLQAPSLTAGEQKRFLALERQLARQTTAMMRLPVKERRSSKSRERTKVELGKLRVRLKNRRTDFVEQTTTMLVREYDVIGIENLRITNMVRKVAPKPDENGGFLPNGAAAKTGLNRAIHGSCWGQFDVTLSQKASRTPHDARSAVERVDPKNTSRECKKCHHIAPGNRESQAVFKCVNCGHEAHADTNAAEIIDERAVTQFLSRSKNVEVPVSARAKNVNRRASGARARKSQMSRVNQADPPAKAA